MHSTKNWIFINNYNKGIQHVDIDEDESNNLPRKTKLCGSTIIVKVKKQSDGCYQEKAI